MPTVQKEAIVAQLKEGLTKARAIYLTELTGLDVAEMYDLRTRLRQCGARLQIAKNTLISLAVDDTEAAGLQAHLTGPTAVLFCDTDIVTPAKAIQEFAKTHQTITIKAAVVEGRVYGREQAQAIADLPPPEQIRGMAVSAIAAPLNGLFGVLNGAISNLVYVLEAVADKRRELAA
jgi:large subunit ribosomal protein L10